MSPTVVVNRWWLQSCPQQGWWWWSSWWWLRWWWWNFQGWQSGRCAWCFRWDKDHHCCCSGCKRHHRQRFSHHPPKKTWMAGWSDQICSLSFWTISIVILNSKSQVLHSTDWKSQVLYRILFLGQGVKEAVDSRRLHHQLYPNQVHRHHVHRQLYSNCCLATHIFIAVVVQVLYESGTTRWLVEGLQVANNYDDDGAKLKACLSHPNNVQTHILCSSQQWLSFHWSFSFHCY